MRQPILYAERAWERYRFWAGLLLGFYLLLAVLYGVSEHGLGLQSRQFLLFALMVGILLGGLYLVRARSYLEVGEEGVSVQGPIRRTELPFALIDRARVQELRHHFEGEAGRFAKGAARHLLSSPSLFLRIDSEAFPALARRLGPREAHGATLAFPVRDPEGLVRAIAPRLKPGAAPAEVASAARARSSAGETCAVCSTPFTRGVRARCENCSAPLPGPGRRRRTR